MQVGRSFLESIGSCITPPITSVCTSAATALRYGYYDAIANISQVKGVNVDIPWTNLEGAQGDYSAGIALVKAELNKLKSLSPYPKRMSIRIGDEHYGAASTYFKVFPTYLQSAGCIVSNTAQNITRLKMWDATCRKYLLDMIQAYSFLDADPYFETLVITLETSITDAPSMTGYTPAGLSNALQVMTATARAAFPHTNISLYNNYLDGGKSDTDSLTAYAASIGVALGGPDSAPTVPIWGYGAYLGTLVGSSVDRRGVVPWIVGVEASELGYNSVGPAGGYTPAQIWDWFDKTMHGSHIAWDRNTFIGTTAQQWGTVGSGGILDLIIAHPTPTYTTCPTRYDSLFGNGSPGSGCNTN